jgi:hypothetical protein
MHWITLPSGKRVNLAQVVNVTLHKEGGVAVTWSTGYGTSAPAYTGRDAEELLRQLDCVDKTMHPVR